MVLLSHNTITVNYHHLAFINHVPRPRTSQATCISVDEALKRKYASNYTGMESTTILKDNGTTILVPKTEYEAAHNSCINGSETSERQFFE